MKSPIAVALIIVGGMLILGPAISDHIARDQIVTLMTGSDLTSVNLKPPPMSPVYRGVCILAGMAMIIVATANSRKSM